MSSQLIGELAGGDAVADATGLAALGEAALRADDLALAYAVSAAGFQQARERWAEFLFLRARALPGWAEERAALCAAAACELARRQRNADLLRRIGEWREEEMVSLEGDETEVAMTTQQIDSLIQREREQSGYPAMPARRMAVGMGAGRPDENGECDCPACRADREEMPRGLERMMEEMGPEALLRALEDIIINNGGAPAKRRRGRSRRTYPDEFSF